jgi:hypothetical protein
VSISESWFFSGWGIPIKMCTNIQMANESRCLERYKSCVPPSDSFIASLLSGKPLNAVFVCGNSSYHDYLTFFFYDKERKKCSDGAN